MIEGDTHNGPEAGPSDWRRAVRSVDMVFTLDERDISTLGRITPRRVESSLKEGSSTFSTTSGPDTTASFLSRPSQIIRTPSQSSHTSLKSRSRIRHKSEEPSLHHLDLQLHTSSSEIFSDIVPPALTRRTTYSSLPPSPRVYAAEARYNDELDQLDEVLGRIGKLGDEPIWDDADDGVRRRQVSEDAGETLSRRQDSIGLDDCEVILDSPTDARSEVDDEVDKREGSLSLWDLLKDEAGEEVWEGWVVDGKWERIANFLAVPVAVEKVTLFGALLCLDGFLYNFTILPIRAAFAASRIAHHLIRGISVWPIPPSHLHSILRTLLLFIPTVILLLGTDASKMYHTVRGQDTIKLYVIFNALEIADRLCGAFGQDVLDTLFARETLFPTTRKLGKGRKRQQARPLFFFMLSLGYVLAHTLIFFYMLVSLNVAINSYDYTLLSLLISNQFVEIKGSVFKKFEKENLFQIMCADIVERFQLSLMLCVIALRNMIEMAGSDIAFLPKSFMKGKSLIDSIFSPVLFVILSEMVVDWLKHAFITKFNHVRSTVYGRFTDVLAKDVLVAGSLGGHGGRSRRRKHPVLLDQSPLVARRLGFASIPLACLVIRIGAQAFGMLTTSSHHDGDLTRADWAWTSIKWTAIVGVSLSAWGCLVALKVLLGLSLLSYSALRQAGMEGREEEDKVNDFGRAPVGESKQETEYNKETSEYLSRINDDLKEHASPVSRTRPKPAKGGEVGGRGGKKGKKWELEEVERWTMVKRIW